LPSILSNICVSSSGEVAAVVTSTSTALDTVAAGCELSVTAYVQESRKRVSGVPANVSVSGENPIPEGSAPPAQVKEYVYGWTPPVAAGSTALWKLPTRRLILLGSGSVNGCVAAAVTTSRSPYDTLCARRKPGSDSVTRNVQKKVLPLSARGAVPARTLASAIKVTQPGQPSMLDS